MLSGNFAEATSAFERSLSIQDTPRTHTNLGMLYYYLGEFPRAIEALEKSTDMNPNDYLAWSNLGDVLLFSNEPERASQAFATAEQLGENRLEVNSRDVKTLVDLAWIKAMLGNLGNAQDLIARARQIESGDPYVDYIDGLILVQLGDHATAISRLEAAVEMGYPLALMAAEPHLWALESEPRFQALIR